VIRAVLFDWGNTLVAWEFDPELLVAGHRAGLDALGLDPAPSYAPTQETFTAAYSEGVLPALRAPREQEIDYAAAVGELLRELGCDADDAAVWRFLVAEQRVWRPAHQLGPSSLSLLDAVHERGLATGLVSNLFDPPALLRTLFGELGLLERLDAIAVSAEIGLRKPHPAIFEHALGALGVRPNEAVMVGDRLREDVGGAQALGMRTIQAQWFAADGGDGPMPDGRAPTPHDVLRLVDMWSVES
jgi:HAD superfamily hydrolase (TIGR01509 family)